MAFQRVQRELSADEIAHLRALRAGGKRLKWLAAEFGISHQTVSRYARDVTPQAAGTRPAAKTVKAMKAARRGELTTTGRPDELIAILNADC